MSHHLDPYSRNMTLKLAVIGGDGIGPEVVAEGLKVLRAVHPEVDLTEYDLGAARWHRTGEVLPDSVLEEIRGHDAILFGAAGDPDGAVGSAGARSLIRLRFELDHFVNLRPVRLYPGVESPLAGVKPADIDMVVVREGTEGPYVGAGGTFRKGTPQHIAMEESINTRHGVERVRARRVRPGPEAPTQEADADAQAQRARARRSPLERHDARAGE